MEIDTTVWRPLAEQMADRLRDAGAITDPDMHRAFTQVPRHVFVPRFYEHQLDDAGELTERIIDADRTDEWLNAVYADRVLLTRSDVTSSSTAPGLMASMLGALDLQRGMRVLEIGTGTGYNTALLCHLVGDAHVTTIDIDPELVETARQRLNDLGSHPTMLVGDGATGSVDNAPYDRVGATCAVATVPTTWLDQTRPDGVLVVPIAAGVARLTHHGDGHATGTFLDAPAYFMPLRPRAERAEMTRHAHAAHEAPGTARPTRLRSEALQDDDFDFAVRLAIPDLSRSPSSERLVLWRPDGSWARVDNDTVEQAGPDRLWDRVEAAYDTWRAAGCPGREAYTITIDADGQRIAAT